MLNSLDWTEKDREYMHRALALAEQAQAIGEVPVGAVIVQDDLIIGEGFNRPITSSDPTAHAEICALRAAAASQKNYRLTGATIYVTLEPCVMCAGAIVAARLGGIVMAARDIRFGAVRSVFRLADSDLQNHRVEVREGLLAIEAADLLRRFFQTRRWK